MDNAITTSASFDYSAVDTTAADRLRSIAANIKNRQNRMLESVLDTGAELIEVKTKLGHGTFLVWIGAEFGWSERTARNYMRTAEVFGSKSAIVSDLPISTIYKLAAPSTPADVRDKVIADLTTGEADISAKEIETAISDARYEQRAAARDRKLTPKQRQQRAEQKRIWEVRRDAERARVDIAARELLERFTTTDIGFIVSRLDVDPHEVFLRLRDLAMEGAHA